MARKPLNGTRMKPNGLPAELDAWFLAEGNKLYGKGGGARLKREVLERYRLATITFGAVEVPQTLVSGE